MTCRSPPVTVLLALLALGGPISVRAAAPSGAATPATTPDQPELAAARSELASLAARIEVLKKEVAAGRAGRTELQPLLARAQELAATIERLSPPHAVPSAPASAPDGQELRERADALRDRADRIERALAQVETRIGELRRRARLEQRLQTVGGAGDVLADSAPRATSNARTTGAAASSDGSSSSALPPGSVPTGGPTGAGGAAPGTAPGPTPSTSQPVATSGSSPSADAATRALSVPPGRELEALPPGASDSVQELLRKRARLQGEANTLRGQADALEADAARIENVR